MTTPTASPVPARRLVEEVDELHDHYARAINDAVEDDRMHLVDELAAAYDRDVVQLIAEREGRTDQLHLFAPAQRPSRLRRLVARLAQRASAAGHLPAA
ncbi:hypothetical protein ENKNEFLB_01247 [Nocardioides aquaticus]|uniref:Uncharacterized protein n=1 Tax=Nocardioides aquaticus TaxID=160826 RepID=A0ABX8EEF3_9ACTN|nr:hypothetical protein [Nocardioides aquaticus]QVT78869.1 hypothetical protein ENKNEFLB_01247 [Nocardioides aquaticus]